MPDVPDGAPAGSPFTVNGVLIDPNGCQSWINDAVLPDCEGVAPVGDWFLRTAPTRNLISQEETPAIVTEAGELPEEALNVPSDEEGPKYEPLPLRNPEEPEATEPVPVPDAGFPMGAYQFTGEIGDTKPFIYHVKNPEFNPILLNNTMSDEDRERFGRKFVEKVLTITMMAHSTHPGETAMVIHKSKGFGAQDIANWNRGGAKELRIGECYSFPAYHETSPSKTRIINLCHTGKGSILATFGSTETGEVEIVGELPEDPIHGTSYSTTDNTITCKDKYIMEEGEGADFAEGFLGESHSYFNYALFSGATVVSIDGGLEEVEITYTGVRKEKHLAYSANSSGGSDPIDSHVRFCEFAGDKDAPELAISNPTFNDNGTFNKFMTFDQSGVEMNEFAGVTSYITPGVVWTEKHEYSTVKFDDIELIGTLEDPESDKAPSLSGTDMNWLVISVTWEPLGKGCRTQIQYRLSGENGWDEDIYNDEIEV